jgi:hypothetical protein
MGGVYIDTMYNRHMRTWLVSRTRLVGMLLVSTVTLLLAACTSSHDLQKDIELVEVSTGWYDSGGADGMNKIVPTVTLRIKNKSSEELDRLQVNAVFRRVGESQEWGTKFVKGVSDRGLAGGDITNQIVLRSERGYTSIEDNSKMLQNREFVDAKVDIFGRTGSRWIKMAEFQIDRTLVNN